ncbi:MAG: hypothetical protein MJ252_03470 [archaeon]|nr:hypothetical protein [archaeon]
MVANLGPADYNYEETVTTLRYADRAKNIKNSPKINEDPKDAMIRQYQEELEKLKRALAEAGAGGEISLEDLSGGDNAITADSRKKIKEYEEKFLAEKAGIEKRIEEEKRKIEEKKNIVELFEDLKKKQEEQEKRSKNKEKLLSKLKKLEEKFVIGEENQKKAKENEELIKKAKEELEMKDKKRIELQNQIKQNEAENMELEDKFKDQDTEIVEKSKLFESLKIRLDELKSLGEDNEKEYEANQAQFYESKRALEKEINLKIEIVRNTIPKKYFRMIESLMNYDEKKDEWNMDGFTELEETVPDYAKQNLAMGYDDEEDYYQPADSVQLREIIEYTNQPKSVYHNYESLIKAKKKKSKKI